MWVTFYPEIDRPVYMPAHVADKIESLTYVEDVAQAVLKVIEKGEQVWDEAYNIALEEEFTLANILLRMRDGLGMKEVLGDSEDSEAADREGLPRVGSLATRASAALSSVLSGLISNECASLHAV